MTHPPRLPRVGCFVIFRSKKGKPCLVGVFFGVGTIVLVGIQNLFYGEGDTGWRDEKWTREEEGPRNV